MQKALTKKNPKCPFLNTIPYIVLCKKKIVIVKLAFRISGDELFPLQAWLVDVLFSSFRYDISLEVWVLRSFFSKNRHVPV